MNRRYIIEMSETQAAVVRDALELYSRLGMGQFEEIPRMPTHCAVDDNHRNYARQLCNELRRVLAKSGTRGISSPEIDDCYRVAFDTMQVIRHRLAWDEHPEGGIQVFFDKPMKTSYDGEPLPTVESVETK